MDIKKLGKIIKSGPFVVTVIFVLALAIRLGFIYHFSAPLAADEIEYDRIAQSLAAGKGYTDISGNLTAKRSPAFPVLLSLIYLFAGRHILVAQVFQALLDSFLCVLIYLFGKKLFGKKVALMAGLLSCIHLGFISQPAKMLTEQLATLFLFISMFFYYRSQVDKNRRKVYFIVITAVSLGFTSLSRANLSIVVFPVVALIFLDLLRNKYTHFAAFKVITIFILSYLLVLSPWVIRNYKAFHAFVPFTTASGIALYTSYTPIGGKVYGFLPQDEIISQAKKIRSEVEQSSFLTRKALLLLARDHFLFFKFLGLKCMYFFSPIDWELVRGKAVYNYSYGFYLPFFFIGFILLFGRFYSLASLYLPVVSVIATVLVFFGIPRFRVPIEPFMILFSCFGIEYLYKTSKIKAFFCVVISIYFSLNLCAFVWSAQLKEALRLFFKHVGAW